MMDREKRFEGSGLGLFGVSVLLGTLILNTITSIWKGKVNAAVSEPYLDEFFHVRQAQLYCGGNFTYWDPKITTPPGFPLINYDRYLISYLLHRLGLPCDISALRSTNSIILGLLVFVPALYLLLNNHSLFPGEATIRNTKSLRTLAQLVHGAINTSLFPPLFFFSALYYTDVASTGFVLLFLDLRQNKVLSSRPWIRGALLVLTGFLALLFRQTNVFWVAVFPAGLQVLEVLKATAESESKDGAQESMSHVEVLARGWQDGVVYDPPLQETYLEDYIKITLSVAGAAARSPLLVVQSLLPYLILLTGFAGFVVGNGGVVLGDKSNHVATLHTPQLLYIWPYIVFFSSPLIAPPLLALITPAQYLPRALLPYRPRGTRKALPRVTVVVMFLVMAMLAVRYNTIVHPFTLADNRHYVFYVFRILLRHPSIKYLAVPVYIFCGWAAIWTLGFPTPAAPPPKQSAVENAAKDVGSADKAPPSPTASYTLIWLLSTTLCLITAPLVEPRYLILPWILWRLRIAAPSPVAPVPPSSSSASTPPNSLVRSLRYVASIVDHGDPRLWAETAWFLAVNGVTAYLFLERGFEWPQEVGVVQRFMW